MKHLRKILFLIIVALTVFSCELPSGSDEDEDEVVQKPDLPQGGTSSNIVVNLDGASALFTQNTNVSRGLRSRSVDQSPLVKILEDGTIEEVLRIETNGEDVYFPNIRFIATGLDSSVYVCFDHPFHVPEENGTGKEIVFIHLTKDNKMTIIENYAHVQDFEWSWGAGNGQDPVIFDDQGAMYYTVWNNDDLKLKRYFNGTTTELNSSSNINVEAFFTDGKYIFFLGRNNQQDNQAYFLRMVDPETKDFVNLFYTDNSGNNTWIRDVKLINSDGRKDILLHGYNIPYRYKKYDDNGKPILKDGKEVYQETQYEGLMKLVINNFGDSTEDYKFEPLLGMSKDEEFFNNQDQYTRILNKQPFFTDAGVLDQAVIDFVLRIFYVDGNIPDGIDLFKEVVINRNDPLMAEFNNREDVYFWYKLLEGTSGLDEEYFNTFKNNSQWKPIFPQNGDVGRFLYDMIFFDQWGQRINIDETSSVLDSNGDIKLEEYKKAIENSERINQIFSSISLKETLDDGTEITGPMIPTALFGDYSDLTKFKEFLDKFFSYTTGSRPIEWFDSYNFFNNNGTSIRSVKEEYRGSLNGQEKFKVDIYLGINQGAVDPSSFNYKLNPDGKFFDVFSDYISDDEINYRIAWEWEENNLSYTYDKVGLLGRYRITSNKHDETNFVRNFFDFNPIIDGIEILDHQPFQNLLVHNDGLYDVNPIYDGTTSLDSAAFLEKIKETTTISNLIYKTDGIGSSILTVGSDNSNGISDDLKNRRVIWEFEAGYNTGSKAATWTNIVTGTSYDYMFDTVNSDHNEYNWIYNFFHVTEGPRNIGWVSIYNKFDDGEHKDRYVIKPGYTTIDDFVSDLESSVTYFDGQNNQYPTLEIKVLTDSDNSEYRLNSEPSQISMYEMEYEIEWELEENDSSQIYDKKGLLGNYRVVNPNNERNSRWFLYNFFNVITKDFDLSDVRENQDLYDVMDAFKSAVYKNSKHGGVFKYKNSFLNSDGSLNINAVENVISKFSNEPTITTGAKKLFFQDDYIRVNPETGGEDWEATRSNFTTTIFDLDELGEYPLAYKIDDFWKYTTDPYNTFESADDVLEFWNLDQFTISDNGEVYGLFRQTWESRTYDIAKLMDSDGTPVQEIIIKGIEASAIKVFSKTIFYMHTSFNGVQSLNRLDIGSGAVPVVLVPENANLEIYKYDVSEDLKEVFFTAQESKGSKLVVGKIDLSDNTYTTEETSGINANSDIEIYSAN